MIAYPFDDRSLVESWIQMGNDYSSTPIIFAEQLILRNIDEEMKTYATNNFHSFIEKVYDKIDRSKLREYENYFVWELKIIAPEYFEAEALYNKLKELQRTYFHNLKIMKKNIKKMIAEADKIQGLDEYEYNIVDVACEMCTNFLDNIILITKIKQAWL